MGCRAKENMKNRNVCVLFGVLIVCFLFGAAFAAAQDVPRISIQELKKMMDDGKPVTIVDVQPKDVYHEGHIKGAVSLPWKAQISVDAVFSLPKNNPIIVYCDCGPGESDSADVASQLLQMGLENVKVLADPSIKGWKDAGYPIEK
jgi:rhodanese-related sulfurtransferase